MNRPAIRTPNELYAHAIAIEREAAETYAELAQHMDDLGNDEVATLFRRLAVFEAEHLQTLEARTAGVALPALKPGEYAWLDAGAPETVARELVYRLLTPRAALELPNPPSQRYGIDPLFLFSLIRQESLFEGFVSSTAGAHGLMQVKSGLRSGGAGFQQFAQGFRQGIPQAR